MKFGAPPTEADHDCNWYYCEFNPAQSGNYHVLVMAKWGNVTGASLETHAAGEICTDSIDNDADGTVDCSDPDCQLYPACVPSNETSCVDGGDNDNDGKIDCTDNDCATHAACLPETQCADGLDSDQDNLIDCLDPDCTTAPICSNTNWVVISNAGFEAGIAPYAVGGVDAARVANATNAAAGTYSVRVRDNSGAPSSFATATPMNLSAYSRMKIEYKYLTVGMEAGDNFIVEVLNGSTWEFLTRTVTVAGSNNLHKSGAVEVNLNTLTNKSAVKIRFRADASDDTDQIFFDNIKVSVK